MGHTLKINTEHSTYSVFLGNDVFDELKKIITEVKPTKVCVVTDEIVRALHLHTLLGQLPAGLDYCTFVAPAGENAKSLQIYEKLVSYCIEQGLDRKSLLIALGGGAIGDLTGFAAATFMRNSIYSSSDNDLGT